MAKSALVLGATGLVGRHLVKYLCESTYFERVIAITRRPMRHDSPKFENHVLDFSNLDQFSDLFAVDVLFSALGTTKKQAGSVQAQRVVDFEYQLHAAKLACERGVKHYLLVSSSGANVKSRNPYLKMKGELEHMIKELNFASVSVFQPSLLLGNRAEHRALEALAGKFMPVLCNFPGLKKYRPIQGEQVALKMVTVAQEPADMAFQIYRLDEVFPE